MPLLLRLRSPVIYPALWLERRELADPDRVLAAMDAVGDEALRDLGGFSMLVEGIEWVKPTAIAARPTLTDMQRRAIVSAVAELGSNKAAARALGIHETTLWRILNGRTQQMRLRRKIRVVG